MKKISIILVMLFWCNVSFAGECIEGDCNNGSGTYTSQAGDRYVGEFKNGKFHGQGTAIWVNGNKYVGEFKNGPVTGQGTMTYHNGSKYVGEFKNGERHGQGTYTYPDGSVVVAIFKKDDFVKIISEDTSAKKKAGCIKGDCTNGQGTLTTKYGDKYVGEFKDGKVNGQGTLAWANGDKYVGEWKNNKKHGQGTLTWSDGSKYVGEWKNNIQNGQGTHTFTDGEKYVGGFKNNKRHGQGTATHADGTVVVGIFKNGKIKKVISYDTSVRDKAKKKLELASMVDDAKKTCKDLGFTEGTDKFSDCSLKLYTLSVESAAKNNQTVVMQPQSSGSNVMTIYDPVRDNRALMNQGMRMLSGACTLGINC